MLVPPRYRQMLEARRSPLTHAACGSYRAVAMPTLSQRPFPSPLKSPPRRLTLREALRTSRKLLWGLVLGVSTLFAVVMAVGSGLAMLSSDGTGLEVTPEALVATERRLQRDAAQGLADAYNRLQARYVGRQVDED